MKRSLLFLILPALVLGYGCTMEELPYYDDSDGGSDTVELTDPDLSWSASSCEVTFGESNTFPTLNNEYGVSVTYSSSYTGVATIAADGSITLVAAGSTTITASSSQTSTYEASSASYVLTVNKSSASISWSEDNCTVTLGADDNTFPELSNPGDQDITYASSNTAIATIDEEGIVTLVSAGATTITATAAENDTYSAAAASYTLNVEMADGTQQSADLSWSVTSFTATIGAANDYPTLSNPHALTISYSSSDESVATISSDGSISLVGEGTAAIVASSDATDEYYSGSASYTLKVVKHSVTLVWSSSSCNAVLGGDNSFPTLTVDPSDAGLSISYASSNNSVATVGTDGTPVPVATGSTTISATFAGNDTYKSASATYNLVVTSTADEGAGTYNYSSTGDTSSDDDISNTTFNRKIVITYSSSGATVTGDYYGYVTVSGNNVTVNNTGNDENIVYELTGSASSGYFKLYSSKKQAILLNGLTLTNPNGAAINNQSGKRTFIMVEGTNALADGSSAAYSTDNEDMKAVIFSEGQLIFSGSGNLTVTANNSQSKSCIASDDYVRFMASPTIKVTSGSSAGHGIRGKDFVRLSDGTLTVATAAATKKGITSEDYVLVEGGTATINITGGVAYDSDDAEYKGSAGIKADNYFAMTGGTVTITNTGAGGKGIRAGSYDYSSDHSVDDSYISGGTLSISTTGSESNDVSSKGMKIGWVTKNGSGDHATVTGYAGNLNISGGSVTVTSSKSEGVEAKGNIVISGGQTYVTSSGDDAINSQGEFDVTGGYVYAYSSQNDAMDANHDMKITGGYVFAVCTKGSPEVALDANTEDGYKLYITSNATVIAYGGLESGYSSSNTVYSMSCTAGSWNALYNGSSYICAFKAPSGVSTVAVTAPSLSSGYKGVSVGSTTYSNGMLATSGISGGTSVTLSTYSGGGNQGGGGGNPGGGGNQGGGPGHTQRR